MVQDRIVNNPKFNLLKIDSYRYIKILSLSLSLSPNLSFYLSLSSFLPYIFVSLFKHCTLTLLIHTTKLWYVTHLVDHEGEYGADVGVGVDEVGCPVYPHTNHVINAVGSLIICDIGG